MAPTITEQLRAALDRIIAHVPEDQREAIRSDYSRAQDAAAAVDTTAQAQKTWWDANKDTVAERNRLAAELEAAQARTVPVPAPAPGFDQNEIERRLGSVRNEMLETGLGLATTLTNIGLQHLQEFGEVLDTRKLTEEAIKAGIPLDQHYTGTVAERRATRATEQRTKEIADAEARGRDAATRELLAKSGHSMPFPVGVTAPTTLTGLKKHEGENPFSLEAAVATANSVMAKQSGSS